MHNGQIAQFEFLHQRLIAKISPEYFNDIQGSTDSEIMFYLALTFGLEKDVPSAIAEVVRYVENEGKKAGVSGSLWMTLGISDGKSLWAFKYGSDGTAPTLYISPSLEELSLLNPKTEGMYGDFAACIVSEPIGDFQDNWNPVSDNSQVLIHNKKIELSDFNP